MKKNMKGFTLIELLAVIVILAIIALIATPIVINVIDNARKNAAKDSAYGVIDAIKLQYTEALYSADGSSVPTSGTDAEALKVSGTKPDTVNWTIGSDGNVTLTNTKIGGYVCKTVENHKVDCSKE